MKCIDFRFSAPIQIRISDLDPYGHVNNGSQLHLFDYGRTEYFEHVSKVPVDWKTMDLIIAHINIDYLKPITPELKIECDTKILEIGNKSIKMIQQLRNSSTNEIMSVCKCVLVSIDRETGKSIPVTDYKRKLFSEFEGI
ncbi:MAG: acyl-CoA thioesterase [Bacteroidales bacterium]|jgi:acyl-CoA thioester hydrolase